LAKAAEIIRSINEAQNWFIFNSTYQTIIFNLLAGVNYFRVLNK
jgi:hypothetical protein